MVYKVIKYVELKEQHKHTLLTTHNIGDEPMVKPYKLQVVRYSDDNGFYLLYLDVNGEELTDTYHEDLRGAMKQAEWEFGISENDWKE